MSGLDNLEKIFFLGIKLFILLFIILAFICACEAYGDTWTIDKGKFKSVYENREKCIKENLGIRTTETCYDEEKVIYKNK